VSFSSVGTNRCGASVVAGRLVPGGKRAAAGGSRGSPWKSADWYRRRSLWKRSDESGAAACWPASILDGATCFGWFRSSKSLLECEKYEHTGLDPIQKRKESQN
jgi:hypothetical protein